MKKKEKKYGLLKPVLLLILIAIALSWLIPTGEFSGGSLVNSDSLIRIGLADISWIVYYGIYFSIDKIIFLLAIGGFYGILTKTEGYDRMTTGIAKKLSNKKIAVVIFSCLIAILTSFLTQTFVVLIFVPFIISILNKMKLDKMTILATTFGSMLIGVLGATYGTEGLVAFKDYLTEETFNPNATVLVRAGILLIGLVLFNFFTLSHMSKEKNNTESTTMFPIELAEKNEKNSQKKSIIPIITICFIGVLLLVICILGYTEWSNWSIFDNADSTGTIFDTFHNNLLKIHIGDFYVFKSILGSTMKAFGAWDLFPITGIIFILTLILSLCNRFKLDELIENFISGAKKMLKPSLAVVGALTLMVVVYMSPYVATISNKILSMSEGFNLATMSLTAIVNNAFHTDLGFSGWVIGSNLVANYAEHLNIVYVIFISLYGLIQFFIPTSVILGVGLISLDVKYKEWLKHIWKFLVGILICLLVIFILMSII